MFDYILADGLVADGSGRPLFAADVGIRGERIETVSPPGELNTAAGRERIQAAGLILCPGFIDLHSHADLALLEDPRDIPKVLQGVTTEVFSSCGLGFAPLTAENKSSLQTLYGPLFGPTRNVKWDWETIPEFIERLDRGASVNVAYQAAHGPIKLAVMGAEDRRPTAREIARMAALVGEALDGGALGLSTGLAYAPMTYSHAPELVALTSEVARRDGLFSIHLRSYAETIDKAVEEAVRVAAESGARLQISHFMVWGSANRGRAAEYGEWIERARAAGVDVGFDAYPYAAGSTVASLNLPAWSADGGPQRQLARLRDAAERRRIIEEMRPQQEIWRHSTIAGVKTEKNRPLEGKNFAAAAKQAGQDVLEFLCDLLIEEELEVAHILHLGSEEDMRRLMLHPAHSFGSDGLHLEGRPHPRLYGAFPRVLGRYVREEKLLPLEQAIYKMTAGNAARLGLTDRGIVAKGQAADLVLFDPQKVIDRATYEHPRQPPDGIRLVMVNGTPTLREGRPTGATPGRVLRR